MAAWLNPQLVLESRNQQKGLKRVGVGRKIKRGVQKFAALRGGRIEHDRVGWDGMGWDGAQAYMYSFEDAICFGH